MIRWLSRDAGQSASRGLFWATLAAYIGFSILDAATTFSALAIGGREGNPIAARVFRALGGDGLLAFKFVVVAVIILGLVLTPRRILSLRVATYVAATFAAVMATVVVHNVEAYASLVHSRTCAHPAAGVWCAASAPTATRSAGADYSSGAS